MIKMFLISLDILMEFYWGYYKCTLFRKMGIKQFGFCLKSTTVNLFSWKIGEITVIFA